MSFSYTNICQNEASEVASMASPLRGVPVPVGGANTENNVNGPAATELSLSDTTLPVDCAFGDTVLCQSPETNSPESSLTFDNSAFNSTFTTSPLKTTAIDSVTLDTSLNDSFVANPGTSCVKPQVQPVYSHATAGPVAHTLLSNDSIRIASVTDKPSPHASEADTLSSDVFVANVPATSSLLTFSSAINASVETHGATISHTSSPVISACDAVTKCTTAGASSSKGSASEHSECAFPSTDISAGDNAAVDGMIGDAVVNTPACDSQASNTPVVEAHETHLSAAETEAPNTQATADSSTENDTAADPPPAFTRTVIGATLRQAPTADLNELRERMFHFLILRTTIAYARTTTPVMRRLLEFILLVKSICCLLVLVLVHVFLCSQSPSCLPNDITWDNTGILRVEIIEEADPGYLLAHSYKKEEFLHQSYSMESGSSALLSVLIDLESETRWFTSQVIGEDGEVQDWPGHLDAADDVGHSSPPPRSVAINPLLPPPSICSVPSDPSLGRHLHRVTENSMGGGVYIMEYALEYGLLRLSSTARRRYRVPVTLVVLDPRTHQCLGGAGAAKVLRHILGYDDVLLAAMKTLAERDGGRGYLRNVVTGEHYRFVSQWLGGSSYVAAAVVMLIFTMTVSLLLRYSHQQIFLFIVSVLNVTQMPGGLGGFPAAPMLTVVLALVGMEAIMSEFFKDTTTAFYIIIMVWICDQYDALCCTQPLTRKHWIRFFYLYHFAFYAYHYRFNGQYSWLALMTSWFFIQHSMLFFFHHYELPAVLRSRPRLQAINVVMRRQRHAPQEAGAGAQDTAAEAQDIAAEGHHIAAEGHGTATDDHDTAAEAQSASAGSQNAAAEVPNTAARTQDTAARAQDIATGVQDTATGAHDTTAA